MRNRVLSDQELVRIYKTGDESALEALINRHKKKILHSNLHICKG